jgi:hypothetical protein
MSFIPFNAPTLFVNAQETEGCVSFNSSTAGAADDSLIKIRGSFPQEKGEFIQVKIEVRWAQTPEGQVLFPSARKAQEDAGLPIVWTWAQANFLFPKSSFEPDQLVNLLASCKAQESLPNASVKLWAYAEGLGSFTVQSWTEAKKTKPNEKGEVRGYFKLADIGVKNLIWEGTNINGAVECSGEINEAASNDAADLMAAAARGVTPTIVAPMAPPSSTSNPVEGVRVPIPGAK